MAFTGSGTKLGEASKAFLASPQDERCSEVISLTEQEKNKLARILAELIRSDPEVHKALLDWIGFNPYIECKE